MALIRQQAITWNNAALLPIGTLGTNFSQIWLEFKKKIIQENALENVIWKMLAI